MAKIDRYIHVTKQGQVKRNPNSFLIQQRMDAENKQIYIYWWNFGKKTLDFKGSYKDYFKQKGIKFVEIHKNGVSGLKFRIPVGSSISVLTSFRGYIDGFNDAVKTFALYLGDKTKFIDGYGREHLINWR